MKYLMISIFLLTSNKPQGCLQLDVMIVVDLSGSVQGYEAFIEKALVKFVNRFELSENTIKMGFITFNDSSTLRSGLTSDKFKLNSIIKETMSHDIPNHSTNLSDALMSASNELTVNGRGDIKKVIILICDGNPDNSERSISIAYDIKMRDRMVIFGILIESATNDKEVLREISSEDSYYSTYYEDLINQLEKLDICF